MCNADPVPKVMTTSEAEAKRLKAVEFLRRIGRDDDADRFESMDAAEYAEHKGAQLIQNRRRNDMAGNGPTKRDLEDSLDQISDLVDEALDPELTREELVAKVKEIAAVANGEEEEEEEEIEEDELQD